MTSTTERYTAAAGQAGRAAEKAADFWTQGARAFSDQIHSLPRLPQVYLTPAVERYFEFVQRTVDMSRDFSIKWVEAASMLSGAVREQAESTGDLVSKQANSAHDLVHGQARQAHEKARERYEGLTKAELSDHLAKRDLPRSGNVDELVERLVEADSK